ncbi:glycosyl transferase [Acinetobacter sp. ANC 4470]|uniref:M66 family metalloprotease n=1 Tax=Acinetobacter sp. ANC 4470 TaxID=1977881 RepID=UPI000A34914D|nr:M66 family metalloprotease [Acinetobacter sp. ANC 4470]OTG69213.1 glycosyl transferase [Acinetobacter sp. ANC 4470]
MKIVTKFPIHTLTICVLSALVAACGENTPETAPTNNADSRETLSLASMRMRMQGAYPEPTKDIPNEASLGFYDTDKNSNARTVRNDLTGNFAAMIQFAQDHTVDPSGNEAKQMPRLTSEKDGLLLVTPTPEMGDIEQLNAEIYLNSRLIRRVALQEPSQIPASDQTNSDNRPRVQYSKRAWTAALNWDEVKPGLNIRIVDPASRQNGRLAATAIDFAPPAELLVQSIRLGMLTAPRKSNGHYMLNEPEKAGTDYLQTIPAARMIVSQYDDMQLNKVMVASGVIYDDKSATTGDVYSGDMRENTAKSTFSTGINLANWGVTSAGMASQQQPQLTQSVVIHHAWGKYQNGDANHGLSGGNGILTLIDSSGNEFSHEIGHHFGLGHYPGTVDGNYFWAVHHHDSGWGYMAYRNRMRGNLLWNVSDMSNRANGTPTFQDKYVYAPDAMSGGAFSSSLSRFTHYTGHSAKNNIQPAFNRAVWDAASATGYKQWNAVTRQMEVIQPKVPNSNNVWYNRTDGNYLKPTQFGVPVFTILGGYDPVNNVGLLYPAARGNWGNVFTLPQAQTSLANASCWINVKYVNKAEENIALAPSRMGSNANKLHINIAQSDAPRSVDLYCKKANEQAVKLSSIEIPTYATALPAAVVIGKQQGFKALRQVELPQLEQALLSNQGKAIANLSPNAKVLYDSYTGYKSELSNAAQTELQRYSEQQTKLYRLNRWVNAYRTDLAATNPTTVSAFKAFTEQLDLQNDQPLANVTQLRLPSKGNACLKAGQLSEGKFEVYASGVNGCNVAASEWIYDAMGKVHNRQYINQCLTSSMTLTACSNDDAGQTWSINSTTQAIHQGTQCLDLSGGFTPSVDGRSTIIRYNCTGSINQQWTLPTQNQSFVLAAAQAQNLVLMINSLQP